MTDVNSNEYQSSPRICDENNSSFILNQSNVPMDIDIDDELVPSVSTKLNGHMSSSSHTIENGNNNEQDTEDVFHQGNPVLNKSFDVLPQIKDDNTPSVDTLLDDSAKNTNVLDTTVELPNNADELDEKPSQDSNNDKPVNNDNTPNNIQSLLSNQFSIEYPYVIPPPQSEEINQSLSPNSVETVTTLTKNMKLNINKTLEGQEPLTPTSSNDKTFDTNTFVLKKKDRRKMAAVANDTGFNTVVEDTSSDLHNKKSPFSTPSVSLDAATVVSRPATATSSSQQTFMDPTRIM